MKIVQTFWTGNHQGKPLALRAGWLSAELHWMSWALSCNLLRRHYDRVELYTDKLGKHILIDVLKLPYTAVHLVFDDFQVPHSDLFSLAKIKTYSLQTEPFIHIDGDVFLWKALPNRLLRAPLISSNLEEDLYFNENILRDIQEHFKNVPSHLIDVLNQTKIHSANAGIIGGYDLAFIKEYTGTAWKIVNENLDYLSQINVKELNFLIEQVSLFYLAEKKGMTIHYLMEEPVTHPLYEDYLRFADVPDVEMIHTVGGCKRNVFVLDHLFNRLRLEFPGSYFRIIQECKRASVPLYVKLYKALNLDGAADELENKLKTPSLFAQSFDSESELKRELDFKSAFFRSIRLAEILFSVQVTCLDDLIDIANHPDCLPQFKEVFLVENKRVEFFNLQMKYLSSGFIYSDYISNYKRTAALTCFEDLKQCTFQQSSQASFLNLGWVWADNTKSVEEILSDNLKAAQSEILGSFQFNPVSVSIQEAYHDDLDAIILNHLSTSKTAMQLADEILQYFEGEISVDNPQYQVLLFDTIKRLFFGGMIMYV